jgi:hypothetical protein
MFRFNFSVNNDNKDVTIFARPSDDGDLLHQTRETATASTIDNTAATTTMTTTTNLKTTINDFESFQFVDDNDFGAAQYDSLPILDGIVLKKLRTSGNSGAAVDSDIVQGVYEGGQKVIRCLCSLESSPNYCSASKNFF